MIICFITVNFIIIIDTIIIIIHFNIDIIQFIDIITVKKKNDFTLKLSMLILGNSDLAYVKSILLLSLLLSLSLQLVSDSSSFSSEELLFILFSLYILFSSTLILFVLSEGLKLTS